MNISDMSANAPVGTTLALLERTLKPMAAVQARVHYAMKQEFKMLKAIMAEYAPEQYEYMPTTGEPIARRIDYMSVDVIPVSDPNSSTMAQRVVQYQAVLQMAQQFPQIYDLPQLHRQMIEVLGIKNADKLVPIQDDLKPVDPISENMNVLMSKPVKAFIEQDHEAHLLAHESFLQDPMILGAMQKNPRGKAILATLHAHIAEHVAYNYRSKVEEQVGAEMPAPNLEFPETLAANIAGVVGKAARDLSAKNAQEQAQKQAMAKAKDPVVQIQKADLQIRQQEAQRKAAKDAADAQVKQQELAIKEKQVQSDALLDIAKLEMEKEKNSANLEKEGIKVGAQIIKDTKR
jgi:hypothetical protein